MTSDLVTVPPGFTVALDGSPDGPKVLLLHGFPQDLRCWELVVGALVGAGYRCARFDQRGYDAAVRPTESSDYVLPSLVGDAAAVLDGLGWASAVVVGHDWGSVVAWGLASSAPDRVSGLVAVSVPHPAAFGAALASDADQQARSAYVGVFRQPGRAESLLLADGARRLRAIYEGLPASVVDGYVSRFSDAATLAAALSWYRAMDRAAFAAVGPVSVPTRFVWGAQDVAVGRMAAEGCATWVTGDYAFVELPEIGHWVPETAPDAIVQAVLGL